LLASGFLTRVLDVRLDGKSYIVKYEGGGIGYEQIRLNGDIATWRWSWFWFVPRFEFPLGPTPAAIDVRVWPWLAIRGFQMTVGDRVVYAEGRLAWPRRFSLWSLLVALTLCALLLGLIVSLAS
jgi:hypothetical protein